MKTLELSQSPSQSDTHCTGLLEKALNCLTDALGVVRRYDDLKNVLGSDENMIGMLWLWCSVDTRETSYRRKKMLSSAVSLPADRFVVFISSWQNLIMTIHVLWNIIAILLAISGLKLTFANEDSKPIEEEKYGVKYATDCEGKLDLSLGSATRDNRRKPES